MAFLMSVMRRILFVQAPQLRQRWRSGRVDAPRAVDGAQNTSASLNPDLTERGASREFATCRTAAPRLLFPGGAEAPPPRARPPHLRAPFLISCCTSSARAGGCCPAPCSPSRPRLGVPSSRRTPGARDSAENRCGQGAGPFAVFVSLISFSAIPIK